MIEALCMINTDERTYEHTERDTRRNGGLGKTHINFFFGGRTTEGGGLTQQLSKKTLFIIGKKNYEKKI